MSDGRWDAGRDDAIERLRRGELPPVVRVPVPERIDPAAAVDADAPAHGRDDADEVPPRAAIAGTIALVVLACIPHLVAPSIAVLVALIAAPLSWSLHRISRGRRRRAYIALAGTNVLVAVLAVAMTLVWIELGVVRWPEVPTG